MAKFRGPEGGYIFGAKKHYRAIVWNIAKRHGWTSGDVACMPSIGGEEINVAVRKGARLKRLHVIDDNPAIVATLQRRHGGRLQTYGVSFRRAFERITFGS